MAKQKTASRSTARSKDNGSEKAKSGSGNSSSTYEEELIELLQERIKPNLNRGSIPLLARSLAKDIASRQRSEEDDEVDEESETGDESKAETDEAPETEDETTAEAGEDEDEPEAEADEDVDEEPEAEADEDVDEEPEDEDEEPADDEDDEPADDEDDEPADDEEDEPADDEDDQPEGEGEGDDPVSAFEEEMHQLQEDLGDEWIVRFSVQNDEAWLTAEKEDGSQHVEGPTADVLREAVELLEGGDESD